MLKNFTAPVLGATFQLNANKANNDSSMGTLYKAFLSANTKVFKERVLNSTVKVRKMIGSELGPYVNSNESITGVFSSLFFEFVKSDKTVGNFEKLNEEAYIRVFANSIRMKIVEITGLHEVTVNIDRNSSNNMDGPKFYFDQNSYDEPFTYELSKGFFAISNPLDVVLNIIIPKSWIIDIAKKSRVITPSEADKYTIIETAAKTANRQFFLAALSGLYSYEYLHDMYRGLNLLGKVMTDDRIDITGSTEDITAYISNIYHEQFLETFFYDIRAKTRTRGYTTANRPDMLTIGGLIIANADNRYINPHDMYEALEISNNEISLFLRGCFNEDGKYNFTPNVDYLMTFTNNNKSTDLGIIGASLILTKTYKFVNYFGFINIVDAKIAVMMKRVDKSITQLISKLSSIANKSLSQKGFLGNVRSIQKNRFEYDYYRKVSTFNRARKDAIQYAIFEKLFRGDKR